MANSTYAQKVISYKNKLGILGYIREQGETTRYDISKSLQLSHTTVKTYVDQFLDEGLVEEAGTAPSMGGRKPVMIRLVAEARYSLGANFAPGRIDLLLLNLNRDVRAKDTIRFDAKSNFSDVLDLLAEKIAELFESSQIDRAKVLGLGMTFPGLVDDSHEMLIYLANLGVRNFSLKPFIEKVGLRVIPENEAQAAVTAEQILGNARGKDNLVYVSIAEGIGAGILINGRIYRTKSKNAGEFGHVKISDKPVQCNCGRTGCWECFASSKALIEDYIKQSGLDSASLETLFEAYRAGEAAAVSVLENYTRNLFKGIDIVLLAYSPDDVIIGGDLAAYAEDIIDLGINRLGLTQGFLGYENTRIIGSALKDNAALLGAALLPMEEEVFIEELF